MQGTVLQERRRPRKALGQHWLVDRRYLSRIANAARLQPNETVIEVGAGSGALTFLLADQADRLIAVEVDPRLAEALKARFTGRPNVTVLCADILELSPQDVLGRLGAGQPYGVIGNFPYFIGTAILRHFLRAECKPSWLVATLQDEVAQRVSAPGGQMSYLAVEMQLFAEARLLFRIPARAFRPAPKVRSAVVRLDVRPRLAIDVGDIDSFLRFAQAGFAAPRKQLRNSLAQGLRVPAGVVVELLKHVGLDGSRRPQTLALSEWTSLFQEARTLVTA